ncbi:MAG: KTSC domain-containing protein [Candidatus Acidiferrales bacterium]
MSWSRTVFSSMVSEVGYDDQAQEMIVTWAKGGKTSAYAGVPEELADTCSRAPSVGSFINSEIKPFYSHRYV